MPADIPRARVEAALEAMTDVLRAGMLAHEDPHALTAAAMHCQLLRHLLDPTIPPPWTTDREAVFASLKTFVEELDHAPH